MYSSPPIIETNSSDSAYRGYFEHQFGEQWVVKIDREKKTGVLRGRLWQGGPRC
jgi:hypothetical protein